MSEGSRHAGDRGCGNGVKLAESSVLDELEDREARRHKINSYDLLYCLLKVTFFQLEISGCGQMLLVIIPKVMKQRSKIGYSNITTQ